MAAALAGGARAFAELVERHQRPLYRSCLRMLRDPDEADDAVQDAFVRAYAHLGDYDSAFRFSTWLYGIARNLCLNRLRRRKLWGLLSLSRGEAPELEARESSSARVEGRELAETLAWCLATLPADQRECFELRHGDELSYAEIARALAVPTGTVMSRLARARRRMADCLRSKGIVRDATGPTRGGGPVSNPGVPEP
ncbi:MAG: RNA polymerase sigma factor [Gemmatimonadota bacterium]